MTQFVEIRPDIYLATEEETTAMARRSATATVDTLEREAAADSQIQPTDLDAEPTNGQAVLDGVRPSERCWNASPLGISCAFANDHTGRHSWQAPMVESADTEPTNETANLELPGMPEPVQTEYSVPFEAAFKGAKLMAAPGLRAIADRLIEGDESLEHLQDIEIRYFWRRRGGTQGGNPRYARIKRPSAYEQYLTGGQVIYMVDLSADHIREAKFTDRQLEACIYSQLCRTDVDPDDHDAYRITGPDFMGTVRELERFGDWSADLREMHAHVAKLPPPAQAAEEASEDEGDDEDGGEEGE